MFTPTASTKSRRQQRTKRSELAVAAIVLTALAFPFVTMTPPDESRGVRRAASILERKVVAGQFEPTLIVMRRQLARRTHA